MLQAYGSIITKVSSSTEPLRASPYLTPLCAHLCTSQDDVDLCYLRTSRTQAHYKNIARSEWIQNKPRSRREKGNVQTSVKQKREREGGVPSGRNRQI